MSEYIGSRISLISKSDIRYVGTLVEINSENSTVALENVMSYGTEDRRTGDDSFPPSASLYDYILFRGSDVKDLRIEEPPKEASPTQPPQMPNDPAILGSARPPKATPTQQPNQPAPSGPSGPQNFPSHPPHFSQFAPPPYPGMPPQGFGRGFPGGPAFPGYPGMHFGSGGPSGPAGWYPPPGQGFPQGQFPGPTPGVPPGAPAQHGKGPAQQNKEQRPVEKDTDTKTPESSTNSKVVAAPSTKSTANAPPPPVESKPDVAAALAPPAAAKVPGPNATKGRVLPVVPLANPKPTTVPGGHGTVITQTAATSSQQSTAQQAAAAVAAAMAKLPTSSGATTQQSQNNGVDNLTRKLNEMRTNDAARQPRNPVHNIRGGFRGRGRGGHQGKVEIPSTDFDFESANKKFNKEDLAKEAQATNLGSPDPSQANGSSTGLDIVEHSTTNGPEDVEIPPPQPYDRTKSFFDNISSELKDREDNRSYGGPEFRSEERRKNIETFGQGSVDGYRGGFRGRGRGRGRGGRGGISFRGRGVFRGRGGTSAVDL